MPDEGETAALFESWRFGLRSHARGISALLVRVVVVYGGSLLADTVGLPSAAWFLE